MNGLSETAPAAGQGEAGGAAASSSTAAAGREEKVQQFPAPGGAAPKEEGGLVRRCLGTREVWIAGIMVALLVVFAIFYLERRPHKIDGANLQRIRVDVGASDGQLTEVAAKEVTDKPRNDKRRYQYMTLPNGLQVLSVQDAESLKTAFAMAVKAGSYDDPPDLPGLAHFCEHMLFLGTKKYPEPSGFDDFMSKSGGQDNAYTASEVTVYFGELAKAASEEGLSRFADFFHEPLFDKRYVKKEVHAIDSEHAKNVQSPGFRILQAFNSLSNPASPLGRFHTGNFDTLYSLPHKEGKDPVEALKVYFKDRYCPKQMHLVTFGAAPLSEQLQKAAKLFGPIPRGSAQCSKPRVGFASPPAWTPDRLGKFMVVEGSAPQPQLWAQFTLPDLKKEFKSQPLEYLDYVLGYQGENSFSRVLQDHLGLAAGTSAMFDQSSIGTSLFVTVTLTPLGRDHPEAVLDVLYAYISVIRSGGVDGALYNTIKDVMKLKWDWSEPDGPSSTASDLAERLTRLPAESLLSGDTRIDQPNLRLVESLIGMLTPANMNVAFVDPNVTRHPLSKAEIKTLPYYGLKYSVENLSTVFPGAAERWGGWLGAKAGREAVRSEVFQSLRAAGVAAAGAPQTLPKPPGPIDGVPKNISLAHMRAQRVKDAGGGELGPDELLFGPRPTTLPLDTKLAQGAAEAPRAALRGRSRDGGSFGLAPDAAADAGEPEVWYRSGWVTNSPKVAIQLEMRPLMKPNKEQGSSLEEASAVDSLRLAVYGRMLGMEMAPKMADLTATGISYGIGASTEGLAITFGGFAPMLPKLVDTVLAEFNRFNSNASITAPSRYGRIVEEMREELTSFTDMPVHYAIEERNLLLTPRRHSNQEALAALGKVDLASAATSAGDLLLARPLQLTALAMGNLDEDEARRSVNKVWAGLDRQLSPAAVVAAADGDVERVSPVVNPAQPVEVRKKNPRPGDSNDATVVSFLFGVGTVQSRVDLGLLGQILQHVAFTELRTSRQLGYVVSAGASMMSNVQFLSTVVQGNVLRADEVEGAIEQVLSEIMPAHLANLTDSEFHSYVESFQQDLLQPPLAPGEEVQHLWGPVRQGGICFSLRGEILKYLGSKSLTRQHLQEVWRSFVMPPTGVRKKLVVKYFAKEVPPQPNLTDAYRSWRHQGLSEPSAKRLLRERKQVVVFDGADSVVRRRLVEGGGYFPRDINCKYVPEESAPTAAPQKVAAASGAGVTSVASVPAGSGSFLERTQG